LCYWMSGWNNLCPDFGHIQPVLIKGYFNFFNYRVFYTNTRSGISI
jgi:hypothetical protein